MAEGLDIIYNAVFGCTELILGIELGGNSKSKVEMNWLPIPILLFGRVWNLLLESLGGTQFQSLFGRRNHGIGCFVEFGHYKLVYMYEK